MSFVCFAAQSLAFIRLEKEYICPTGVALHKKLLDVEF